MCCFPVADVFLEDPPPEKKEEKKDDKVKKNYVLVSDQPNFQPIQPIVSEHPFSAARLSSTSPPLHTIPRHPTPSTTTSCLHLQDW